MDFYAMQMTPRKKKDDQEKREENLKKYKEHVVTKEELIAELGHGESEHATTMPEAGVDAEPKPKPSPNFLSPKSFSIAKEEITKDVEFNSLPAHEKLELEEKQVVKKDIPTDVPEKNKIAPKKASAKKAPPKSFWPIDAGMLGSLVAKEADKKTIAPKMNPFKAPTTIAGNISDKKEIAVIEKQETSISKIETSAVKVEDAVKHEEKIIKTPAIEKQAIENESKPPVSEVVSYESSADESLKMIAEKEAMKSPDVNLEERILKNFTEAVTAFDEKKINDAVADLIAFRSEDPKRIAGDYELNVKLREKIIATVPALFAYKGGKAVLSVLQLLDEMSIEFSATDFAKLPSEVLKSEEMRNVGEKYLLWFAKDYPDVPGDLEKRIVCFARSEILTYQEIRGFSGLQVAISTDLINFIKENVQDPHDVERKIYEFALAGLVDGKQFKALEKVKNIIRRYVLDLIMRKKDHPAEAAKKIDEYEKAGFIKSQELLEDDKIGKFIDKYLSKFEKDNKDHPRKISALVREYFNAGLISKETRDKFLK